MDLRKYLSHAVLPRVYASQSLFPESFVRPRERAGHRPSNPLRTESQVLVRSCPRQHGKWRHAPTQGAVAKECRRRLSLPWSKQRAYFPLYWRKSHSSPPSSPKKRGGSLEDGPSSCQRVLGWACVTPRQRSAGCHVFDVPYYLAIIHRESIPSLLCQPPKQSNPLHTMPQYLARQSKSYDFPSLRPGRSVALSISRCVCLAYTCTCR
jgi:hypothetical protein